VVEEAVVVVVGVMVAVVVEAVAEEASVWSPQPLPRRN
jgi:hypothetical protein